ncbi:hypothetical protein M413DRAFT_443728 [Hebeloma cylindrosporum]|uniref:Uncharacterized protein n=1 Tax=Hebeloma cylindrosporum TaxID=76867 RepID=A0A0C2YS38_HEBCY|nr:hypothetical protein M413DRAFT_443728 [Hebeloma cylindrosporum h7]
MRTQFEEDKGTQEWGQFRDDTHAPRRLNVIGKLTDLRKVVSPVAQTRMKTPSSPNEEGLSEPP